MRKTMCLMALAGVACGGVGNTTSYLGLCQGVEAAIQNLAVTCYHANAALLGAPGAPGPYGSTDRCANLQKAISSSRIAYDPLQGIACLSSVQALTCADLTTKGQPVPASCRESIAGQVDDGAPCYLDDECRNGSYCTASRTNTCPGACLPKLGVGGDCSPAPCTFPGRCFPAPPCADGLACDGLTCKISGGPGSACPCQDAYWCDTLGGLPGSCKVPKTSGDCAIRLSPSVLVVPLGVCATGYVCASTTATCLPLVGEGGDCSASPDVCGDGYHCSAGSCISWPNVGASCGWGCIGGYCDTSRSSPVCVAYQTTGGTCTADIQCASRSCGINGKCGPGHCASP
jgi:hypothetical protein